MKIKEAYKFFSLILIMSIVLISYKILNNKEKIINNKNSRILKTNSNTVSRSQILTKCPPKKYNESFNYFDIKNAYYKIEGDYSVSSIYNLNVIRYL